MSIYLDANTGNATFGRPGEGQIKLVPGGTSTIAGWTIDKDSLHTNDKKAYGDSNVGAFLGANGTLDFTSSKGNYLRYNGNDFFLNGGTITGGSIDIGNKFFYAEQGEIRLGDFIINTTNGRQIFQSTDKKIGLSTDTQKSGGWWFWCGSSSENIRQQAFIVNKGGQAYAYDFILIENQKSIRDSLKNIQYNITKLWERIEEIGDDDDKKE